jgi:K+-sensing histidine kinase KdpD
VTGLFGYLEMMQDHDLDPEVRQYVEKCLTFTRTIQSQIAFTKMVDDIRNKSLSWQYAERMITHVLEGYHIGSIICRIHLEGLYLYADPILEKVIFTLIENSIRHGDHVSRISFSYHTDGAACIFVYEDDGTGIPMMRKRRYSDKGMENTPVLGCFWFGRFWLSAI